MCSKLCSIYQRTVIIAIYVVGPFIGWPIELHCLNIFLILLQFGKESEKKTMNLTKHCFFFAVSAGIVHFQLPNLVYLRVVCVCTFLLYINRITICIMANGSFQEFREYRSQSYTCNQKTPLTKYLTDEIVQFFYYIFFLFKKEGGSCHSLGTRLLRL